jgi:hypothetical protein
MPACCGWFSTGPTPRGCGACTGLRDRCCSQERFMWCITLDPMDTDLAESVRALGRPRRNATGGRPWSGTRRRRRCAALRAAGRRSSPPAHSDVRDACRGFRCAPVAIGRCDETMPHRTARRSRTKKPRRSGASVKCAEEDSNLHPVIPARPSTWSPACQICPRRGMARSPAAQPGESGRIGRGGCCHERCRGGRGRCMPSVR